MPRNLPRDAQGATRFSRIAREVLMDRYRRPAGDHQRTTLRSIYYKIKRTWIHEQMEAGEDYTLAPGYDSFQHLARATEETLGQPLEDAGIYREARGYVYLRGRETIASEEGLETLNDARLVLLVEKSAVAHLLGDSLARTRIGILSTQGIPVRAHTRAIQRLQEAGTPVVMLSDYDAGGDVVSRELQQMGVKRIGLEDLLQASGVTVDMRQLVLPDTARFANVEKTIGTERLQYYRSLARLAGLKEGTTGKIELDALLDTLGTGAPHHGGFTGALTHILDRDYPRPPGLRTTLQDIWGGLQGTLRELQDLLRAPPAPRGVALAPGGDSWAEEEEPLEGAMRDLQRSAQRLLTAIRGGGPPGG